MTAAMTPTASILAIAAAMTLGAMSPGPSFILVARTALASSRRDGLAAAVGMGAGGILFAGIAVLGLLAVLAAVPALHLALKLGGGAYLVFLGVRIVRAAGQPLPAAGPAHPAGPARVLRSFLTGLGTQVSNPKTAIVYAGIFASLLPPDAPGWMLALLPPMVFAIETAWYALVAVALSAPAPRARYLASKAWIDRAAGALMGLLGLKLIIGAAATD